MEEHAEGRCNVVYYCAGLEGDVREVYHADTLPESSAKEQEGGEALKVVHHNVHALLDEDRGGLDEGRDLVCAVQGAMC